MMQQCIYRDGRRLTRALPSLRLLSCSVSVRDGTDGTADGKLLPVDTETGELMRSSDPGEEDRHRSRCQEQRGRCRTRLVLSPGRTR